MIPIPSDESDNDWLARTHDEIELELSGLHAHQALPLAGAALGALAPRGARVWLVAGVVAYVAGWAVLMAAGLGPRAA